MALAGSVGSHCECHEYYGYADDDKYYQSATTIASSNTGNPNFVSTWADSEDAAANILIIALPHSRL